MHSDVQQVMCGYNRLNGVPCCTNRRLFEILRREWRYDGILVTDCWALNDAYETDTVIPRHRTHATAALAYGDAFGHEVDLECGSGLPALKEAVKQGLLSEWRINEHVRRVLKTRLTVTTMEAPQRNLPEVTPLEVARQSMVLLKNNGILPLKDKVAMAGPNVWDTLMPLGNYNGTPEHTVTVGEAFAEVTLNSETSKTSKTSRTSKTIQAKQTVIYVGGLSPQLEGEELQVEKEGFYKGDRTRIELPREQVEEIKKLKAEGNNIVLVLCNGSAIALEDVIEYCDAVLVAWYGGQDMGTAVKQLLYGESDDFGHLPMTFYRSTDQLPEFEDYNMQGRTYRYIDDEVALFPFGYGLSYSFYQLYETQVSEANFTVSGIVSQCNTDVPEAESHRTVIQVYLQNPSDSDAPYKQLIGMAPVTFLKGNETMQPFTIQLDPYWFRQYNPETGMMEEPEDGVQFNLQVGFSSADRDLADYPFVYHNRK